MIAIFIADGAGASAPGGIKTKGQARGLSSVSIHWMGALPCQVLHVHIGAEPHVIGAIPAGMVMILVDHGVSATPEPAVDEAEFKGCDSPIPATGPEQVRDSAAQAPVVRGTE